MTDAGYLSPWVNGQTNQWEVLSVWSTHTIHLWLKFSQVAATSWIPDRWWSILICEQQTNSSAINNTNTRIHTKISSVLIPQHAHIYSITMTITNEQDPPLYNVLCVWLLFISNLLISNTLICNYMPKLCKIAWIKCMYKLFFIIIMYAVVQYFGIFHQFSLNFYSSS